MLVLTGKTGNAGLALGPVAVWDPVPDFERRPIADVEGELVRFDEAVASVAARLRDLAVGSKGAAADILNAQKMMLEDASFQDGVRSLIRGESVNAEYACVAVGATKAEELERSDSPYLRARGADVRDVARKVALALMGNNGRAWPDEPSIVYADEITPQDVSSMPEGKVLAFVTKTGSPMSHAAILCGNYGIPFLFGIDCPGDDLRGVECAVDAARGELVVEPDRKTRAAVLERIEEERLQNAEGPAIDLPIKVCANIGSPEDAKTALECGADGVGLYRTEFLYMNRDVAPDEDEQFEAYRAVLETMGDREVIVRTMDVGADKPAPCLDMPQEPNPALGHRALRVCLDDPELFRVQLRALLRAARYGNLAVMFPMVASPREIDDAVEQLYIARDELARRGIACELPPVGIMVETPAAAVLSDVMARKVDFFSIGTNDLAQYTLAVDRQGKNLERYFKADHDAVMRLIETTVRNAHAAGIPVGVCGEIGGNPAVLPALVEMGVDELSMSPAKIGRAKALIASELGDRGAREGLASPEGAGSPDGAGGAPCEVAIVSPADGEVVPMEEIPDQVFSRGTMGRCMGVLPSNGNVHAPCKGVVTMVAETRHAFSIRTDTGANVLVHVGIDTVSLNGKGFECLVGQGDAVEADDLVMRVDLDAVAAAGLSPVIVVAVME